MSAAGRIQPEAPRTQGILASHAETHGSATEYAEKLAAQLREIVGRILGPEPEQIDKDISRPAPGSVPPSSNSFAHGFSSRNSRMALALDRVQAQINRLDGAL